PHELKPKGRRRERQKNCNARKSGRDNERKNDYRDNDGSKERSRNKRRANNRANSCNYMSTDSYKRRKDTSSRDSYSRKLDRPARGCNHNWEPSDKTEPELGWRLRSGRLGS